MQRCFECHHDNEDGAAYCVKCGTPLDPKEYSRVLARRGANETKKPPPVNKFDEGVREFFTSRTFKTLLTLGLSGACCIGLIYFSMAGAFITFITAIMSAFSQ